MTTKSGIVERLGDKSILLPALLGDGLTANDRIKLILTLLQEATAQAGGSGRRPNLLTAERQAAGLGDAAFDNTVTGAQTIGPDRLLVPGIRTLLGLLRQDLASMLAPLEAADPTTAKPMAARFAALSAKLPTAEADQIDPAAIKAITAARRGGQDSVHLLTMDLHKCLNKLSTEIAGDVIDGAHVYHVNDEDRVHIKAFMHGLNRTAPLAFGHPGLGTTAARSGERLTIQNDIGTTDAHVLVIHVDGNSVTVTYTDIHRPRAKFFMGLFNGQNVSWSNLNEQSSAGLGEEDVFYLLSGRFQAGSDAETCAFLDYLASRIVYLIDWNKARKALQIFVGKNVAIDLLAWAAKHDYGHRAFLELGGTDLVFDAVRHVAAGRIPYGVRLDHALGVDGCREFLCGALRDCSQGLSAGRTARLIRDEIHADLSQRFETAESAILTVLVRHLGLSRMLAGSLAAIIAAPASTTDGERAALALQAKRLEEKADRLTVQARDIAARIREPDHLRPVIEEVENAADAFDECAFLLSLVPEGGAEEVLGPLTELADIAVDCVSQLVRALEAASQLPYGQRSDAADALQAVDAVINAERRADQAARKTFAVLMSTPATDARLLMLSVELTRNIETATDHLCHGALSLRDRVLEDLSA